ncbi:MAG: hypothetical protein PHO25_07815 [Syntrophomonadaceae bacterium]|nr:hypothetical protein [Syntrophomonadaceae bacterium]
MKKRILSLSFILAFMFLSILPTTTYAASPKEGDYVDPVEYYDLQRFAGMQLTAKGDISKAIQEKDFLPVELVLEPLALDYAAIRMAAGNSDPSSGQDTYPFNGNQWILKAGEKSSYSSITHSGGSSGHYLPGSKDENLWEWNASINLSFNNVVYSIEKISLGGVRFDLAYEAEGTASGRGSQEFLEPGSVLNNMTFTGEYTLQDSVDGRIDWYVDDDGFLRVYLNPRGSYKEKLERANQDVPEVSEKENANNQANVWFKVASVKLGKIDGAAGAVQGQVDTRADKEKGETSVPLPEALAISILGIGAAIAGAGSGSGENNGRKSRYKMCLRKDFGDAIRYDRQPVSVYARIVEITPEGDEIDRPDLTASIDIVSGGNLSVESCQMVENYMGALVSAQTVPGRQNPGEGVVSIKYTGEAGSFQNNVTFRLIGKPYISFPEQGNYLTMTIPMLLDDEGIYETWFVLNDFMGKPTSVKCDPDEGAPFSCAIEEIEENQYILKVQNNSAAPEAHKAVKQTAFIGIRAENEQELAENSVKIELYPEGLSVRDLEYDENGYALVETFDNESTDEYGDVLPTRFVVEFAVPEVDGNDRRKVRVMEPDEFTPVLDKIKGTDERTIYLVERFKYTIEETVSNLKEYKFAPQEALVEEEGHHYYVTLPVSCTYGDKEYTLDLPIRLIGGGPGPMAGWDEEFAQMKRIVSRVGGISPEIARVLRENGQKMSTAELRLLNKRICQDAIVYYTRDAAEYNQIADELDNMIYYAEWIKWFGDQAFSYLISTYYGNTADAILSPAKDIFASFLGEVIGTLVWGEKFDFEQLETGKNINAAFDNLIGNAFDDKIGKKVDFKQVCVVVGGFLVWKIAKNLYDNLDRDGKMDLYAAITATAGDLTAMGMKSIAGSFFQKALKNKVVQENLSTPMAKWLQDVVPDTTLVKWNKGQKGLEYQMVDFAKSDVIKKYLEEFFGMGMAKVMEIDMAAGKRLYEISSGSSIESTIEVSSWPVISWTTVTADGNGQPEAYKVSIDLKADVLDKLYEYLFEKIFADIPFAKNVKPLPNDPPYYAQRV